MKPLLAIVSNEARLIRSDPFPLFILVLMPLILVAFVAKGFVGGAAAAVPGLGILFGFAGLLVIGFAFYRDHGWNTAVLVTEPFHVKRATLIAHDDGMTVYPSPAVNSANWSNLLVKAYNVARDTLSLMLYQVKSLTGDRT